MQIGGQERLESGGVPVIEGEFVKGALVSAPAAPPEPPPAKPARIHQLQVPAQSKGLRVKALRRWYDQDRGSGVEEQGDDSCPSKMGDEERARSHRVLVDRVKSRSGQHPWVEDPGQSRVVGYGYGEFKGAAAIRTRSLCEEQSGLATTMRR